MAELIVRLVKSAPKKIAGASQVPKTTKAPMAKPDGDQIGEAKSFMVANLREPQPIQKYKIVTDKRIRAFRFLL